MFIRRLGLYGDGIRVAGRAAGSRCILILIRVRSNAWWGHPGAGVSRVWIGPSHTDLSGCGSHRHAQGVRGAVRSRPRADVQPRSNRELVLKLFVGIARVVPVYLDSLQEQVLFACVDSDRLNFGKLAIVIFNFSAYPRLRNNSRFSIEDLGLLSCSAPVRL
jgi:hypothetical protein